ncbi:hypothetical protein RJ639_015801 [Escallonia herrerae]|uniref:Chalcone/stilbene synthase N-terminal domain-containing protein n=1 Tax=Escallonia herrerae TaxID=1293975 RepID=A0AA88VGX7_9ASTE|nr:hypothetical protein RJ639_015801 [Escallonia herrerae]
MVVVEIPKLGKEAVAKAIKEWGQPKSKITHLVFCTTSNVNMPEVDYQLTKLLGLRPSVKRLMMYQQGRFVGDTVLRLAKDLAENNAGARVLVVCSENHRRHFLWTLGHPSGLPQKMRRFASMVQIGSGAIEKVAVVQREEGRKLCGI